MNKQSIILIIAFFLTPLLLPHSVLGGHIGEAFTPPEYCEFRTDAYNRIIKQTSDECILESEERDGYWKGPYNQRERYFINGDQVCSEVSLVYTDHTERIEFSCLQRIKEPVPTPITPISPTKPAPKKVVPQKTQQSSSQTTKPAEEFLQEREIIVGVDVKEGDIIKGQKGFVTKVFFDDGSRVDVLEGGELKLESAQANNKETSLLRGIFRVLLKNCRHSICKVRHQMVAIVVRGTEFTIDTDANEAVLRVIDGEVSATDAKGKAVSVKQGEEVTFDKSGASRARPFDITTLKQWWRSGEEQKIFGLPFLTGIMVVNIVFWGSIIVIFKIIRIIRKRKAKI